MRSHQQSILIATIHRAVAFVLVLLCLATPGCIERVPYEETAEEVEVEETDTLAAPEPQAPPADLPTQPALERGDNDAFVDELDTALTVKEQPTKSAPPVEPDDALAEDLFGDDALPSPHATEELAEEETEQLDLDAPEPPIAITTPDSSESGPDLTLPDLPAEPTPQPTSDATDESDGEELTVLLPEPSLVPQFPPVEEPRDDTPAESSQEPLPPTEQPFVESMVETEIAADDDSPPLNAEDYVTIDLVPSEFSSTPPLELPTAESTTTEEPPVADPTPAMRRSTWQLGSRLSLVRLASQIGASPEATARRWEEVEALADRLDLPRPVRRGYRGPTAVPSDRRAELDALVTEGRQLGAQIAAKYGPENAALFETALKSNLLLVLLGPDEPLVDTIIQAVNNSAGRAKLPEELWQPTLEQLAKRPRFVQVEGLVFKLHENVADYLADESHESTGGTN